MIKGTRRALEKRPSVKADFNASIHNRFDIEVVDAKTGKVKQRAQAENVICDYIWTVMFKKGSGDTYKWGRYIQYGSGSGTPSTADTALFNYVGYKTPSGGDKSFDGINHVASLRRKITLTETEEVGVTITEVGLSNHTSGEICTHAMLTDMNGNPVGILKTSTDIINIYATVFAHWSGENDDWFALSDYTSRNDIIDWLCGISDCGGPVKSSDLTGNSAGNQSVNTSTFSVDPVTKTNTVVYQRVGASTGNNGRGGYGFLTNTNWVMRINPKWFIPPRIFGEAIGTGDGETKDFATTFRDVNNAVVYVDGVETPVSVDAAFPLLPDSDIPSAFIPRNFDGTLKVGGFGAGVSSGSSVYISIENIILENPNNDVFGVSEVVGYRQSGSYQTMALSASNDMVHWTTITTAAFKVTIPEDLRRSRYFKVEAKGSTSSNYIKWVPDTETRYNIHFAEPPAAGAVITADYNPGTIAKDANHVFDFQITYTVGAYTQDT